MFPSQSTEPKNYFKFYGPSKIQYLRTCLVKWNVLSYFRPTKFKFHYVAPQFFIFRRTVQIAFIEMCTYFSFGLILWDIPNSITPQTTLRLLPILVGLLLHPCTHQCRQSPLLPLLFPPLFRTDEPVKAGTCAHDRRALQQLALNVHVKHSELT